MTVRVLNLLTKQVHLVQEQDLRVVCMFMEVEGGPPGGEGGKNMFGVYRLCVFNKRQPTIVFASMLR